MPFGVMRWRECGDHLWPAPPETFTGTLHSYNAENAVGCIECWDTPRVYGQYLFFHQELSSIPIDVIGSYVSFKVQHAKQGPKAIQIKVLHLQHLEDAPGVPANSAGEQLQVSELDSEIAGHAKTPHATLPPLQIQSRTPRSKQRFDLGDGPQLIPTKALKDRSRSPRCVPNSSAPCLAATGTLHPICLAN